MINQSKGFVLISALIALVGVSSLAAINLSKAQNELKLAILQKDGFNAMNACHSAQKVAFEYLKQNSTNPTSSKIEVDLSDGNFNPLQKNPSFEISGGEPDFKITTTCYGTERNVKITITATVEGVAADAKIVEWSY